MVGPENGGDGNLHITLPENGNVAITGPFSNGPKVVDENGDIIPGDDNLGGLFFESEGIVPSTSTGSIAIGDGAFEKDETTGKSPAFPNNSVKDPFSNNEYESPADTIPADEVVISNVTSIGKDAFKGNENVERITIPADCTSIGADAFAGCTNLKEIIFEGPRTAPLVIEDGAFAGCTNLNTISTLDKDDESGTYTYTKGDDGVLKFPEKTIQNFPENVFTGAGSINKVVLPGDVASVDANSFYSNISYEVTLPVEGFMHETSYPEGGKYPETGSVTFTGTWGENGINYTQEDPEKYGSDDYTWTVNNKSSEEASIVDIVAGKGGKLEWNAKQFTITSDDELLSGKSATLTFGENVSIEAIKEAFAIDGYDIEVTLPEGIVDGQPLSTIDEALINQIKIVTKAKSTSINILQPDGTTNSESVTVGKPWSEYLKDTPESDVKYAFGSDDTLPSSGAIDVSGKVTADVLTQKEISRYYPVSVDGGDPIYYKAGKKVSEIVSSYENFYVSSEPITVLESGAVTPAGKEKKVDGDTKYVYQIFKITFDADGNGKVGSAASVDRWFIKGATAQDTDVTVTPNKGLAIAENKWHKNLATVNADDTYYAVYKLATRPSGLDEDILIGRKSDGSSKYTLNDFLPENSNGKYYYFGTSAGAEERIDSSTLDKLRTTETSAEMVGWVFYRYYSVTFTGAVEGTGLENTCYKENTTISVIKEDKPVEIGKTCTGWTIGGKQSITINSSTSYEIKATWDYITYTFITTHAVPMRNGNLSSGYYVKEFETTTESGNLFASPSLPDGNGSQNDAGEILRKTKYITFEGWYDNPEFTGTAYTDVNALNPSDTENTTFYAKWSPKRVYVVFSAQSINKENIINVSFSNDYPISISGTTPSMYIAPGDTLKVLENSWEIMVIMILRKWKSCLPINLAICQMKPCLR